ncbi:MAG: hypothetical protein PVS3B1_15850 [Ktedonobacteraceae bacterium]
MRAFLFRLVITIVAIFTITIIRTSKPRKRAAMQGQSQHEQSCMAEVQEPPAAVHEM